MDETECHPMSRRQMDSWPAYSHPGRSFTHAGSPLTLQQLLPVNCKNNLPTAFSTTKINELRLCGFIAHANILNVLTRPFWIQLFLPDHMNLQMILSRSLCNICRTSSPKPIHGQWEEELAFQRDTFCQKAKNNMVQADPLLASSKPHLNRCWVHWRSFYFNWSHVHVQTILQKVTSTSYFNSCGTMLLLWEPRIYDFTIKTSLDFLLVSILTDFFKAGICCFDFWSQWWVFRSMNIFPFHLSNRTTLGTSWRVGFSVPSTWTDI